MSRVCQVTGKKPMKGHLVSHANNKTIRTFEPNLHYRRFWLETQNRWVRLRVSTAGLRRIDKLGVEAVLAEIKAKSAGKTGRKGWVMREKKKLESSAGTGHFYTTTKNKRTTPDKIEIKKYDPKARKHVIYKETKLK